MRELTEYEKKKWFDGWKRFNAPEFLTYGDELGAAYDAIVELEQMGDYFSDELALALATEALDMYYFQMAIYPDEYGGYESVESLGLPPHDILQAELEKRGETLWDYIDPNDKMRETWDWAVDWREEHQEETYKRLKRERLERELERLKTE